MNLLNRKVVFLQSILGDLWICEFVKLFQKVNYPLTPSSVHLITQFCWIILRFKSFTCFISGITTIYIEIYSFCYFFWSSFFQLVEKSKKSHHCLFWLINVFTCLITLKILIYSLIPPRFFNITVIQPKTLQNLKIKKTKHRKKQKTTPTQFHSQG